ncbi:hypothetical protein P9112_008237 [Eukaryota sp. TZLM1-RC]
MSKKSVPSPPSNVTYATQPLLGCAEPFSSWTHLVASVAAVPLFVRLFFLIKLDWQTLLCTIVYTFSVFFCLVMSGVYHMIQPYTMSRLVMRRLDHSAIFCLIAGSFTGIHGVFFTSYARWIMPILLWVIAINGIVLKTVFFNKVSDKLGLYLYLIMGWLGSVSFVIMLVVYKDVIMAVLLIGGGVAYSIGGVIDSIFEKEFKGIQGYFMSHEVFHVFVVLGLYLHYELVVYGAKGLVE